MKLSEIIKNYRAAQSLSMDGFAKAAGLSKPYISMLEKEKNSNGGKPIIPSLRTLQKIAAAMNLRLDELMKRMDGEETVSLAPLPAAEEPPPKNANDRLLEREERLIKKYRYLSPDGKTVVDAVTEAQYNIELKKNSESEAVG